MFQITINDPLQIHLLLRGERLRITGGVKPLVSSYARKLQRDVIRSMVSGTKSGRVYIKPGGRRHQASAPGESPARDTGKLVNSIRMVLHDAGWTAKVGSPQPYAIYLEDGTSKIRPRPAFASSLSRYRKPFIESVRALVEGRR